MTVTPVLIQTCDLNGKVKHHFIRILQIDDVTWLLFLQFRTKFTHSLCKLETPFCY